MGGENLHEIQFTDAELPLENLVIRDDGFRKLLTAFNTQRCLNPSISLGLAEGAFDEARNYVKDRTVFGKAIGDFQGIRWKLAEMYREIEVARSILTAPASRPIRFPILSWRRWPRSPATKCPTASPARRSSYMAASALPMNMPSRGSIAARVTARSGGGTTETLRDLIGKRIMNAAETGEELLAYDMVNGDF